MMTAVNNQCTISIFLWLLLGEKKIKNNNKKKKHERYVKSIVNNGSNQSLRLLLSQEIEGEGYSLPSALIRLHL